MGGPALEGPGNEEVEQEDPPSFLGGKLEGREGQGGGRGWEGGGRRGGKRGGGGGGGCAGCPCSKICLHGGELYTESYTVMELIKGPRTRAGCNTRICIIVYIYVQTLQHCINQKYIVERCIY